MKKLFYLFLFVGLAVISCNKPDSNPDEIEVSFLASMGGTSFKSSTCLDCPTPSFDCDTEGATYAKISINDGPKITLNLIFVDGILKTQSIKLPAPNPGANENTYELTSFELYNDADDCILAVPLSNAPFGEFVTNGLPLEFSIDAFFKKEVSLQVLCYTPTEIEAFGFSWFSFDEITVRELCFFGDICVDNTTDYEGSAYEDQRNGLQHDMPAIFKVIISTWNNTLNNGFGGWDAPISVKDNMSFLGEGDALCIQYPDYTGIDLFKTELWVYVKTATGFDYELYKTWNEYDGDNPVNDIGDDGVIDFVLGDCVLGDIVFTNPEPRPEEPPAEPGSDCGECDGKITRLVLKYQGSSAAMIQVRDKKGSQLFTGNVANGNTFEFDKYPGKKDMGSSIKVYVNGSAVDIHTSCSQPIGVGSVFGTGSITLTVMEGESRNGGFLCEI